MTKSAMIPVYIDFDRFLKKDNSNIVSTQEAMFDGRCLFHENNLYSPCFWEDVGDPAFTESVVSGRRFRTIKEAETYGREAFGDHYIGVQKVSSIKDDFPF